MRTPDHNSRFRLALKDRNGEWDVITIIAFGIGIAAIITIGLLITGEFASMIVRPDHSFRAQELGIAIGAVLAGFGPFLGAYAAYWAMDGLNAKAIATAQNITEGKPRVDDPDSPTVTSTLKTEIKP